MLPSTTSSTQRGTLTIPPRVDGPPSSGAEEPVVFRVLHLPNGGWRLEKAGGEVGGLFVSKHAALSYACAEAGICCANSVLIDLEDQRRH